MSIIKKHLVIAEKTKTAKTLIEGLQGKHFEFHEGKKKYSPPMPKAGYYESDDMIVTYLRGHILRLKTIEEYLGLPASPRNMDVIPYMPERFELAITEDDWYKTQFAVIKELINRKDVDYIVHFGDPDNEGELIVREILGFCGNTHPVKRLWCNSLVPEVVADAYYDLKNDNDYTDMYYMAMARQQFDWFYGINVSRFLTKKTSKNFPAGRILIPITNYVYERDMQIKNFKSSKHLGIDATLHKGNWNTVIRTSKPEISVDINNRDEAEKILKRLQASDKKVTKYEKVNKTLQPKKLFNLSNFQSFFNKKYGYDLSESLDAIQKLYELGFVTYPRTPVEYLSSKEAFEMEKIINKLALQGHTLQFFKSKNVFDDKKCVGGHSALTITSKIPSDSDFNSLAEREQRAYMTIFNRTVSNFVKDKAVVEECKLEVTVGDYLFNVSGERVITQGFLAYESRSIKGEIPEFAVGESVNMDFVLQERETVPPSKVTLSQLLSFLANPYTDELKKINKDDDEEYYELLKSGATLGTESTTAKIVDNAQKYGYISAKKNTLSITEKGIAFIELLKEFNINLFKDKNIEMNKTIRLIGNKAMSFEQYKQNMYSELSDVFDEADKTNVTINLLDAEKVGCCPLCGHDVVEKLHSFQCANKDCKFYIYKEDAYFKGLGKKVTKTTAKSLLNKGYVKFNKLKSKKTGKEYSAIIKVDYSNVDFDNNKRPVYTMEFPTIQRSVTRG